MLNHGGECFSKEEGRPLAMDEPALRVVRAGLPQSQNGKGLAFLLVGVMLFSLMQPVSCFSRCFSGTRRLWRSRCAG